MKKRFLVQRLDTEMYFCHPSEGGEFKQWTKKQDEAHKWVELDSCIAAARTSDMIWGIPARVKAVVL